MKTENKKLVLAGFRPSKKSGLRDRTMMNPEIYGRRCPAKFYGTLQDAMILSKEDRIHELKIISK